MAILAIVRKHPPAQHDANDSPAVLQKPLSSSKSALVSQSLIMKANGIHANVSLCVVRRYPRLRMLGTKVGAFYQRRRGRRSAWGIPPLCPGRRGRKSARECSSLVTGPLMGCSQQNSRSGGWTRQERPTSESSRTSHVGALTVREPVSIACICKYFSDFG